MTVENHLQQAIDREQIKLLTAQVAELRRELRKHAIKGHIRRSDTRNGGWMPNGGSCEVCKAEWPAGWPERHAAHCLLAVVPL